MLAKKNYAENNMDKMETLESYISTDHSYTISKKALYVGFQHRTKVEFLKFFIV